MTPPPVASRAELLAGLAPETAVLVDPRDPDEHAAVRAAAGGQPLDLTTRLMQARVAQDWTTRARLFQMAAFDSEFAPEWVDQWGQARPQDPDMALLVATMRLQAAWRIRNRRIEGEQNRERTEAFQQALRMAEDDVLRSITLGQGDPLPLQLAIDLAAGAGDPWPDGQNFAAEARAIAPRDAGWQRSVCRYLSPRWNGSLEQAWEYAIEVAVPGEESSALPLSVLADAAALDAFNTGSPEMHPGRGPIAAKVHEAIAMAAEWMGPTVDPVTTLRAHNDAAFVLGLTGRHAEALTHFLAMREFMTSIPWSQVNGTKHGKTFMLAQRARSLDAVAPETPAEPAPTAG